MSTSATKALTIRYRILAALAGLSLLLAWWLASPGPVSPGLGEEYQTSVPQLAGRVTQAELNTALAMLHQSGAWSAGVADDAEAGSSGEAAEQERQNEPKPEGLDRFSLIGVIRVQGQAAEALLLDGAAEQEDLPASLLAREGELLRGTRVRLARITPTRALLQLNEQMRWLELFPNPEREGEQPGADSIDNE